MNRKLFFGWKNCKRLIKEFLYIYSSKPSFFSKKRIESGTAFLIAQLGMIYYFITHVHTMDITDLLLWASAEFAIAGYVVSQIQKEKMQSTADSINDSENI